MNKSAIGIDIGGTAIKAGIVDIHGEMLKWDTIPTEALLGKDALLIKIVELIKKYQLFAASNGVKLVSVGIGTAGFVNFREGKIAGATENLPGWGGTPLRHYLETQFSLPVKVDNDINTIALGELWLGAGRSISDFVCIAIGTGIGGCLVINGKPYRGRDGYAGVYGHQVIVHEGKKCNCGKQGCWEQYASVTALKQAAAKIFGEQSPMAQSSQRIFEEARAGNLSALSVIDRYSEYVAVGLTNAIHAFNPQTIVIGGAITAQGDFLFDRIRNHVQSMTLSVFSDKNPIEIIPALLGEQAGVIGAAWLAFEASLQS
jgi:glucokinase